MSDLISREEAIERATKDHELYRGATLPTDKARRDELLNVMCWLNELPSAEPQWIPVSERMPEEGEWIGTKEFGTTISDEVYVTFESPKGEKFCKHICFQNGKLSRYDQMEIDAFYKGAIPIAWKPLPKPYEGDKQ